MSARPHPPRARRPRLASAARLLAAALAYGLVLQALLLGLAGGLQAAARGPGIDAAALATLCSPTGDHGGATDAPGHSGRHDDGAGDPCCLAGCGSAPAAAPVRLAVPLARPAPAEAAPVPPAPVPDRGRPEIRPLGARAPPVPA